MKRREYWHGTTNGYTNYNCRCPKCKAARAEYARFPVEAECDACGRKHMRPRSTVATHKSARKKHTKTKDTRLLCPECQEALIESTRVYDNKKHCEREKKRRERERRHDRGLTSAGKPVKDPRSYEIGKSRRVAPEE